MQDQVLNGYCLILNEGKLVNVLESLLKSIPEDIDEDDKRFDTRVVFISNFIHQAIKYVAERNQDYRNIRQYQYIMNMLLFAVKSKELMEVEDIKRMFNSEKAIDSWFEIINKRFEFSYISKHMKCMVYQILTEIIKIDAKFTRQQIMMWTYKTNKIEEFMDRITYLVQYYTDSVIGNDTTYGLNHHETDYLSDHLEIHYYIGFMKALGNNCRELQDYFGIQHNRIRNTNLLSSVATLMRVGLSSVKYQFTLKTSIDAFELIYALINQQNQQNKDFFMSIRIYEYVSKVMNLGWFTKDFYYSLDGEEQSISDAPVFNSNKLILELKLKALEVSNQLIDENNKHEFSNSIGTNVLDQNLKLGYAQLKYLNNGVNHRRFFDKNDKVYDNFNIKMLFEGYYMKVKISKEEVIEQNVIQIYDTQNIFYEAVREVRMGWFKLFKSRSYNFSLKDYNKYSK